MKGKALLSLAAFITAWEAAVRAGLLPHIIVPAPSDVALFLINPANARTILTNLAWTAARATAGFALGLAFGLAAGLLLSVKSINEYLMPIATIFFAVPSIAWIPILIVWVGFREFELPVVASFLSSFPPVLYGFVNAVRTMDPEQVGVAMVLGAKPSTVLRRIVIPQALLKTLPLIKTEAVVAWKTTFAAEMVALPTGLGALAMTYATTLETDGLIAVVAILAAITLTIVQGLDALEKRVVRRWVGTHVKGVAEALTYTIT